MAEQIVADANATAEVELFEFSQRIMLVEAFKGLGGY